MTLLNLHPSLRTDDKPAWQQIVELFRRFGAAQPPTKLRDELVAAVVIARRQDRLVRALTAMLEETEGLVTLERRGLGLARYQALEAVEAATGERFMPSRRSA